MAKSVGFICNVAVATLGAGVSSVTAVFAIGIGNYSCVSVKRLSAFFAFVTDCVAIVVIFMLAHGNKIYAELILSQKVLLLNGGICFDGNNGAAFFEVEHSNSTCSTVNSIVNPLGVDHHLGNNVAVVASILANGNIVALHVSAEDHLNVCILTAELIPDHITGICSSLGRVAEIAVFKYTAVSVHICVSGDYDLVIGVGSNDAFCPRKFSIGRTVVKTDYDVLVRACLDGNPEGVDVVFVTESTKLRFVSIVVVILIKHFVTVVVAADQGVKNLVLEQSDGRLCSIPLGSRIVCCDIAQTDNCLDLPCFDVIGDPLIHSVKTVALPTGKTLSISNDTEGIIVIIRSGGFNEVIHLVPTVGKSFTAKRSVSNSDGKIINRIIILGMAEEGKLIDNVEVVHGLCGLYVFTVQVYAIEGESTGLTCYGSSIFIIIEEQLNECPFAGLGKCIGVGYTGSLFCTTDSEIVYPMTEGGFVSAVSMILPVHSVGSGGCGLDFVRKNEILSDLKLRTVVIELQSEIISVFVLGVVESTAVKSVGASVGDGSYKTVCCFNSALGGI